MEATPGIEPGYTDLQSAASPLRHVAEPAVAVGIAGTGTLSGEVQKPFAYPRACSQFRRKSSYHKVRRERNDTLALCMAGEYAGFQDCRGASRSGKG